MPRGRHPTGSGFQFCPCVGEREPPRANNITHMLLRYAMQLLQDLFEDAPFF